MPSPLPQYNILGVGEAPKTLADFEGLTVRATGGIGKAMEAVKAVPTSMSATEVRQSLDGGVVKAPHDDSFNVWEAVTEILEIG